ncbi:MAG: hypothetical protein ACHP84_05015 [Caulobacterales bacterium]
MAGIAAVVLLAMASFLPRVFIDGDTNWHVAAGRWILDHGQVPKTDPFSYTFAGKPWLAHEWLSEVFMTLAWRAAGWSGVVLLIGAAAGLAYALIAAELRLWLGPLGQAIGLALSVTLLEPFLFARPHVMALPMLVIWTRGLLAARRRDRAPHWRLLPLMVLWANLHASFIFGVGLIGPFALEALAQSQNKPRALVGWGLFGVVALLLALATPHGVQGLIFPFQVLGMKTLPDILEWRSANFQQVGELETVLLITLFLGLWRGVRVPLFRLLLLIALVHMVLQHIRQQSVLAVLAPLLLAEPFGRAVSPARKGTREPGRADRRLAAATAAVAAVVFLGVAGYRLLLPVVRQDNENVPVTALAHVPADIRAQPVFNEYAFGGYLIFSGVRPYVDGRADMYGDDFVKRYLEILSADQPQVNQAITRWGIRWTILSPRGRLVAMLDRSPGWRRLYADRWAVVHVADDRAAKPANPYVRATAAVRPRHPGRSPRT